MTAHPTDLAQPSPDWRAEIEVALGELRAVAEAAERAEATAASAEAMANRAVQVAGAASAAAQRATQALTGASTAFEAIRTAALPPCDVPITEHRAAHRFGRPARLDVDAELRAFVLSRIDRLTYAEIATEIARHFPPARHLRKSALQAWWSKRRAADPTPKTHPR